MSGPLDIRLDWMWFWTQMSLTSLLYENLSIGFMRNTLQPLASRRALLQISASKTGIISGSASSAGNLFSSSVEIMRDRLTNTWCNLFLKQRPSALAAFRRNSKKIGGGNHGLFVSKCWWEALLFHKTWALSFFHLELKLAPRLVIEKEISSSSVLGSDRRGKLSPAEQQTHLPNRMHSRSTDSLLFFLVLTAQGGGCRSSACRTTPSPR